VFARLFCHEQRATGRTGSALYKTVSGYSTGFADLRGGGSNFSSVTIYQAKEQLIKGHCEIWAWGNGEAAYNCTVAAPDKAIAEILYSRASERLSQCLGPDGAQKRAPGIVTAGLPVNGLDICI